MNRPRVSIIISNYNGKKWLKNCLESLIAQDFHEPFEIILVDDASTDGSAEYVKNYFSQVKVIALDKEQGFTGSNNIGAKHAQGEYLIFVNPDTKAEEKWLDSLVIAADGNKQYKILCPIQTPRQNMNRPFVLNAFGMSRLSPFESTEEITSSLFAAGGCFLIRKEWLNKLGYLFDPYYFCFAEDVELSLRTILMGGEIGYVKNSRIWHYHGGAGEHRSILWASLILRNSLLTYYKLFKSENFVRMFIAKIFHIMLRFSLQPRRLKENLGLLKGLIMFFAIFRTYRKFNKKFQTLRTRDDRYIFMNFLYEYRIWEILFKKMLYGCV